MLVSRHPERGRARAALPQLRQARLRDAWPELPDERVHGGDRASSQVERLDEIVAWKNAVAREQLDPIYPCAPRAPGRDGLRATTSTSSSIRSSARRARSTTQPCHRVMGHQRRSAELRLGRREPLVRAALLPRRRRPREAVTVKVVVTGASGFIGSHVVDKLRAHGPRAAHLRSRPLAVRRPGRDGARRPALAGRTSGARSTAATPSSTSQPSRT